MAKEARTHLLKFIFSGGNPSAEEVDQALRATDSEFVRTLPKTWTTNGVRLEYPLDECLVQWHIDTICSVWGALVGERAQRLYLELSESYGPVRLNSVADLREFRLMQRRRDHAKAPYESAKAYIEGQRIGWHLDGSELYPLTVDSMRLYYLDKRHMAALAATNHVGMFAEELIGQRPRGVSYPLMMDILSKRRYQIDGEKPGALSLRDGRVYFFVEGLKPRLVILNN
jgi:hypothetical protein